MSTQPTPRDALSMARDLEALDLDDIAAELLRLHDENAQLREQNTALDAACAKLEAVRGTQPTDDEIKDLYLQETGFNLDDSPAALLDFARAVLSRWGTPATGGEPFASVQKDTLAMLQSGQRRPWDGGARLHPAHRAKFETDYVGVFASPQLVREPLSDEQITGLTGVPSGHRLRIVYEGLVRATERAHGITGGQT